MSSKLRPQRARRAGAAEVAWPSGVLVAATKVRLAAAGDEASAAYAAALDGFLNGAPGAREPRRAATLGPLAGALPPGLLRASLRPLAASAFAPGAERLLPALVRALATAPREAALAELAVAARDAATGGGEGLAFAADKILGAPELAGALSREAVATPVATALCERVDELLRGSASGRAISPRDSDELLSACSALSGLLSRSAPAIAAADPALAARVGRVLLRVFSLDFPRRELASAAAVGVAHAASLARGGARLPPSLQAARIADGLALRTSAGAGAGREIVPEAGPAGEPPEAGGDDAGLLELELAATGTSLAAELQSLTVAGRLAAIRSFVAALPSEVLLALPRGNGDPLLLRLALTPLAMLSQARDGPGRVEALETFAATLTRAAGVAEGREREGGDARGRARPAGPPGVPLPASLGDEAVEALRPLFEEPDRSVAQAAHDAFGSLLVALAARDGEPGGLAPPLRQLAADLVASDPGLKGRYKPLAALARAAGPSALSRAYPELVGQTLLAACGPRTSSAASALLRQLWSGLHAEAAAADTAAGEAAVGTPGPRSRAWALQARSAVAAALADPATRERAAARALPLLLEVDPTAGDGLPGALEAADAPVAASLAAARALRAAGRAGDAAEWDPLLRRAAASADPSERLAALETLCAAGGGGGALPRPAELELALDAVGVELHEASNGHRDRVVRALSGFLVRIRTGAAADARARRRVGAAAGAGPSEAAAAAERFLHALGERLLGSLYPGAPSHRATTAARLLAALLSTFRGELEASAAVPAGPPTCPVPPALLGTGAAAALLDCLRSPWASIREGAAESLLAFPGATLPGLESPAAAAGLVAAATRLLFCPRARDAEGGALVAHVVLTRLVIGGGWSVSFARRPPPGRLDLPDHLFAAAAGEADLEGIACTPPPAGGTSGSGAATGAPSRSALARRFLSSLAELAEACLEAADRDPRGAWERSLAHGPLLALRTCVSRLDGEALREDAGERAEWARLASSLVALVRASDARTAPLLCTPHDLGVEAGQVDADDVAEVAWGAEGDGDRGGTPGSQLQLTACWGTSREASQLLVALALAFPEPRDQAGGRAVPPPEASEQALPGPAAGRGELSLDDSLWESACRSLELLMALKHNGAVDAAGTALGVAVSELTRRRGPGPALELARRLLARTRRPGQAVEDVLRRSGGVAAAFAALVGAVSPPTARRALADEVAAELLRDAAGATAQGDDAGQWPQVHAFNSLRALALAGELADEHVSAATEAGLEALHAPDWETRNAAQLCLAAASQRALGYRNDASVEGSGARRGTTAEAFFARHPRLLPVLLRAFERGGAAPAERGAAAPGPRGDPVVLLPALALLERLEPEDAGAGADRADGGADGVEGGSRVAPVGRASTLMPPLRACLGAPNAAVRLLAAEAVAAVAPSAGLETELDATAGRVAEACAGLRGALENGDGETVAVPGGRNALHGELLALVSLARRLPAGARGRAIRDRLLRRLAPALPLADLAGLRCPPLTEVFLLAVSELADPVRGAPAHPVARAAAAWAWEDVAEAGSLAPERELPGRSAALGTAARLLFGPLWEAAGFAAAPADGSAAGEAAGEAVDEGTGEADPPPTPLEVVEAALASPARAVRVGALGALRARAERELAGSGKPTPAIAGAGALATLVAEAVGRETDLQARVDGLSTLDALLTLAARGAGGGGVSRATAERALVVSLEAAAAAAGRRGASRDADLLAASLGCAAAAAPLGRAVAAARGSWPLAILRAAGAPTQPSDVRANAALFLRASGTLLPAATGPRLSPAAWQLAVSLCQDEDDAAREQSAAAIGEALVAWEGATRAAVRAVPGSPPAGASGGLAPSGPLPPSLAPQVALDEAVGFLGRLASEEGGDAAAGLLCRLVAEPPASSAAARRSSSRVFDREEDNARAEPLFVAQLGARALGRALAVRARARDGDAGAALSSGVGGWAAAACEALAAPDAALDAVTRARLWMAARAAAGPALPRTSQGATRVALALGRARDAPEPSVHVEAAASEALRAWGADEGCARDGEALPALFLVAA